MTITQTLSSLGTPPTIDDPATFETRADSLLTTGLPLFVTEMNEVIGEINQLETDLSAALGQTFIGTSISSLVIGTGSKTFTTQAGKQFTAGVPVIAASVADPANYMAGTVVSYSGTTLVLNVTAIGGSGTVASWNLSLSGVRGPEGPMGSMTNPVVTGTIVEDIFTITDAAAFEIDPGNGSIQLITLVANRTPKGTNFAAGNAVTLMVDDGTARTLTWTDTTFGTSGVVWKTDGGVAPTLNTTGYTVIVLWKVGTQVYGARVGNA